MPPFFIKFNVFKMEEGIEEIEVRELGSVNVVDITIYYIDGSIENLQAGREFLNELQTRFRNQKIEKITKR